MINENISRKKAKPYAIKSGAGLYVKDIDLSKRVVTGLYNAYNFYDSDNDVLLKGSSQKSIAERGPQSQAVQKIKHLLFHDWERLPGKLQLLEEREVEINGNKVTGPYFETKMAPTQDGNDALINYQEGIYDNHSIGFQYLDGEFIDDEADDWQRTLDMLINPEDAEKEGYMYLWKEIRLFEGSTVAFGANALTPYLGVKSGNKDALLIKLNERINLLTKNVRNGKQTDETLQKFEMEVLQLNQIINELFSQTEGSSIKDILREDRRKKESRKKEDMNVNQLLNIF